MKAERKAPPVPASAPIGRMLVVVNRRAGGVLRRPGLASDLARLLGSRGEVEVVGDPDELAHVLNRGRAEGIDTLGICGGDGTNMRTLTALASTWRGLAWPRIALLRGGTVNTAATNLGTSRRATTQLAHLLQASDLRVRTMPLLRVNGRIGFIFGSQLVARVMDEYYAGATGPLGSAALAVRIVTSAITRGALARRLGARETVDVEIDGQPKGRFDVVGLVAAVVAAPAVGMRATHRGGEDGGFHLVVTERAPSLIAREVARLWAGLPVRALCVDTVARSAMLETSAVTRYTLDGDMFEDRRIELGTTAPVEILTGGD